MFEPEWMEYFQREAPISYYCILFLQFSITVLFYFSYLLVLLVVLTTFYLLFSGIKTIKIKLVEDKKHKKTHKEKKNHEQLHENLYLDRLDRNIKKKKKHK
jgi:ABC-type bacteriocin/lantibiotic exporter with double-glycine peptidase domain